MHSSEPKLDDDDQSSVAGSQINTQILDPRDYIASNVSNEGMVLSAKAMLRQRWAIRLVCVSHLVATWGVRQWEFGAVVVLTRMRPGSLLWVSILGLVMNLAALVALPALGMWLDRSNRLHSLARTLAIQEALTAGAGIVAWLSGADVSVPWWVPASVVALTAGAATAARLSTMAVERDWVVVITAKNSAKLASTNVSLRRIDLTCLLASPIAAGALFDLLPTSTVSALVAVWALCAVAAEWMAMRAVYNKIPALASRSSQDHQGGQSTDTIPSPEGMGSESSAVEKGEKNAKDENGSDISAGGDGRGSQLASAIQAYVQEPIAAAAVSLALLYMTVLSLGSLQASYVLNQGWSATAISALRGVGAVAGLLGSILYPLMARKSGVVAAGIFGGVAQWVCLAAAMSSFLPLAAGNNARLDLLCGAVAVSRAGLWIFDLSVTQQMQESVREQQRGTVNGVQQSLQSTFELFIYLLSVWRCSDDDFPLLCAASFAATTFSLVLYLCYACRCRDDQVQTHKEQDISPVTHL